MFCPNCGNQLPDNAAVCGRCGSEFKKAAGRPSVASGVNPAVHFSPRPAVTASRFSPAVGRAGAGAVAQVMPAHMGAGSFSKPMSTQTVGALLASAVSLICLFLPWLQNSEITGLRRYSSYVGINLSDTAAVFDLEKVLSFNIKADSSIYALITIVWLAIVALLVVGVIFALRDKKPAVWTIVAGAATVAGAGAWCFFFTVYAAGSPFVALPPAWVALFAGIAVVIFGILGRREA